VAAGHDKGRGDGRSYWLTCSSKARAGSSGRYRAIGAHIPGILGTGDKREPPVVGNRSIRESEWHTFGLSEVHFNNPGDSGR
jgi:hypothetical protein